MSAARDEPARITIEVAARPDEAGEERVELQRALAESPRRLPSKYFYDERGSRLFVEITHLPEYYQTRTEKALLTRYAPEIARLAQARELVELGPGAAAKSRLLLDAMAATPGLERYVPIDVSETFIREAATELTAEYPELMVHGVVGDFLYHLAHLPAGDRKLVIFLGSTIGNLRPAEADRFLASLSAALAPGDSFLLGLDLIKDPVRIERAYNDSAGLTAEFNRNILRVINERFAADFKPERFRHRAFYDPLSHAIEMRLVSEQRQKVIIGALELEIELAAGEEILTETSTKFEHHETGELLARHRLEPHRWFEDEEGLFGLMLTRRGKATR